MELFEPLEPRTRIGGGALGHSKVVYREECSIDQTGYGKQKAEDLFERPPGRLIGHPRNSSPVARSRRVEDKVISIAAAQRYHGRSRRVGESHAAPPRHQKPTTPGDSGAGRETRNN